MAPAAIGTGAECVTLPPRPALTLPWGAVGGTGIVGVADGIADGIVDGIMVHVIVMAEVAAMADGIVMVHVIDIVVAEDRCMVQAGDTPDVPVGPGLAFAVPARAVRETVAAARAAAAMRREGMVLSSAGRGLGDRVRGIRHTEMKASC